MSDANELESLRAQNAKLEAELAAARAAKPPKAKHGRRSPWWAISSAVLIVIACLLAPLSVTSVWASSTLSDTQHYVDTVAPLADDPAVQSAIADDVTAAILEKIDPETVTNDILTTLAAQPRVPPRVANLLPALAVPLTNGIESFTRDQVDKVLASPQFAKIWDEVNRVAHEQVVKVLEGNAGGAVSAQGNQITLNLGPIIALVKDRLVAQGFSLAQNIPAIDKTFVLVQSGSITKMQRVYDLLNTLGAWLPFVALAFLAAGVALARDRRRALMKGSLGVVAAMVTLGVLLAIARLWYVGATPGNVLTEAAAGDVFDTLVRFLRTGLRATAVLFLLVALAAFLTGPSTGAVRTRRFFEGGIGSMRGSAESAGWNTGRVGSWTFAHKRALRIAAVIAGGLVLMFWTRPSAWVVVVTALVVVLFMFVVEFLASPPTVPAGVTPAEPSVEKKRATCRRHRRSPHATGRDDRSVVQSPGSCEASRSGA